jgi:hypothetical protein
MPGPDYVCPAGFARHDLLPGRICSAGFARQDLPSRICPAEFAWQNLPGRICLAEFARQQDNITYSSEQTLNLLHFFQKFL